MGIEFNNYGINQDIVEKNNLQKPKAAKEFKNIDDAMKFASKDAGDEAIIETKDDKGNQKFLVIDIQKDISSSAVFDPNNMKFEKAMISRDNQQLEFVSKPSSEINTELESMSEIQNTLMSGKISGLSEIEALNHPEKAEVYKNNLDSIIQKHDEVIKKVKEHISGMPEGNDKEELKAGLVKLEAGNSLVKVKKTDFTEGVLQTKLWTAKAQLNDGISKPPLAEVQSSIKEKELDNLNSKLGEKKYENPKEGSYFFKEAQQLKAKAEELEKEIKFLRSEPKPSDDSVIAFKEEQLGNLKTVLENVKPNEKVKLNENISSLEKEIQLLKYVKPMSAEEVKSKQTEISGIEGELNQLTPSKQEAIQEFKEKAGESISSLKENLNNLKDELKALKEAKPPVQKDIKAKKDEIVKLEKELFPLDNKAQDIAIAESISAFEKAGNPADKDKFADQAMESFMKKNAKFFTPEGKVRNSTVKELGDELLKGLQDEGMRKILIHKFKLDTPENLDMLVITMGAEAHGGIKDKNWYDSSNLTPDKKLQIREDVYPVGAAALNRHLTTLMVKSTEHYAKNNGNMDGFEPPALEKTLSIGKGTRSPLVAYAALTDEQIKFRREKMKDSSGEYKENYKVDEKAAKELLGGNVNLIIREKEYKDPKSGEMHSNISDPGAGKMTIKTQNNNNGTYTVNTGTFFNYVSPADVIPIMDMNRGWVQTPNQHQLGTFSPASESFFRLPGVPGERDMNS